MGMFTSIYILYIVQYLHLKKSVFTYKFAIFMSETLFKSAAY